MNTALRISDILSLKWKDVYSFENTRFRRHICLTEQKTGKETMIAINTSVSGALTFLMEDEIKKNTDFSNTEYIFTNSRNKVYPLSRYQAYRIVKEAAVYSGTEEHVSCHSLRKTFGYFAWKQGVPPAMLMNIYNHSSYQITKRYLCIEQDDKDDVYLKINL